MIHKGWHSRGYLPHFDSAETIQFVTFRLADSLPRTVAESLAKRPDGPATIDSDLDGGHGACWLRDPAVADLAQSALLHFDGQRYRLLAWCIMPNHVHVVVEPGANHGVGAIVHSWKSFWQTKPTGCSLAVGHSGIGTTSIGTSATRVTWREL